MSKEDHPIDCPLEIDISSFCSSKIQPPRSIQSIEDLPNLKDLLKQRDSIVSKRARIEDKSDSRKTFDEEINDESISRHGNYRLFALINHLGGSSDVGEEILPFSSSSFLSFRISVVFSGHYTSTVYDGKTSSWFTYDDTSVSISTEDHVLKSLARDAYGVMYMHK